MKTKLRRISESKKLTWADFSTPETDAMEKKYLPRTGEGENMATQTVTAVCKLIYKWFNDGDVFDNTYALEGWANDLSSYANWLDGHVPEAADVLARIENVTGEDDYTRLLYDLMNATLNQGLLSTLETIPATDSVYDCDGPYEFKEPVTCPECGSECDEYDLDHYGMCSDCYNGQNEDEEFYESRKARSKKSLKESEEDGWPQDVLDTLGTKPLDDFESLLYELRNCTRGSMTGCETFTDLADYIRGIANTLLTRADEIECLE